MAKKQRGNPVGIACPAGAVQTGAADTLVVTVNPGAILSLFMITNICRYCCICNQPGNSILTVD